MKMASFLGGCVCTTEKSVIVLCFLWWFCTTDTLVALKIMLIKCRPCGMKDLDVDTILLSFLGKETVG